MKITTHLLVLGFFIMAIVSCKKEEGILPSAQTSEPELVQPHMKKGPKPFSGSLTTQLDLPANLPCNCGTNIDLGTSTGSGNFSHMGNTSVILRPCVSFTQTGIDVAVQCGTLTAANGDKLYTNINPYTLTYSVSGASGNVHVDFTGGTGRFEGATGGFDATLNVDFANNGTLTVTSGTINY